MVRLKGVKTARVSLEAFEPESRDVESRDEDLIWSGDLIAPCHLTALGRSNVLALAHQLSSFHHVGNIFA